MIRYTLFLAGFAAACALPAQAQDSSTHYTSGESIVATHGQQSERQTKTAAPGSEPVVAPQADQAIALREAREAAPQTYVTESGTRVLPVPPGARLVQFDRSAWLDECRNRLASYDEGDRARMLGSAAGSVVMRDPTPTTSAYGECEAYLDDYMASAYAGEIVPGPTYYGQEYMLVPITVTVPQKAVWREVESER